MAIKKAFRVKKNTDFDAIFKAKNSFANRNFVVYQLNRQQPHYRVGLSVSKKLGNAVVRNQIKRRIRHILREKSKNLVSVDFVLIARKGVENLDYQAVRKNLTHILKLSKLLK